MNLTLSQLAPFPPDPKQLARADAAMERLSTVRWAPCPCRDSSAGGERPWLQFPSVPHNRGSCYASKYWHDLHRFKCRKPQWRSLAEILQNPPTALARNLDDPDMPFSVKVSIAKRYAYIPSQFNPHSAAALYSLLAGGSGKVLDPCAGWGDRLAAALSCDRVTSYHGFDANSLLQQGYRSQVSRYKTHGDYRVGHAAFEDVEVLKATYNMVLTSPPYYRAELYSGDDFQSSFRYNTYTDWLQGFFKTLIYKSYLALKKGGYLALNLQNGKYDYNDNYCDLIDKACVFASEVGFVPFAKTTLILGPKKQEPIFIWTK